MRADMVIQIRHYALRSLGALPVLIVGRVVFFFTLHVTLVHQVKAKIVMLFFVVMEYTRSLPFRRMTQEGR